ncbi:MAG: phosphate acyltransferase PlsX [Gammaproteobacteria bacterium]|nr:MAG: phosphate acyltransferase PlsX [Gammaproteobacteria bacterium]
MTELTLAIDAMGGDHGLDVTLPATMDVLQDIEGLHVLLVGKTETIQAGLQRLGQAAHPRLELIHASEQVAMDEAPAHALRNKKDSSMRVAVNLVKEGRAHACVSAGNTGALMAISKYVLKTLPGVDRPAIIFALPCMTGKTHMLDLGANIDVSPENLLQFAVMGAELCSAVEGLKNPSIGLVNIGSEDIKGNELVKEAHQLLRESDLNYVGYIEGNDVYEGKVDVAVCDGFVGNVALKTSEGVAKMIAHFMKLEFNRNLFTRFAGLCALGVLKALRRRMDPREYNGASLVGLRGIVIKSHGGADRYAFANAIREAYNEARMDLPNRIQQHVQETLRQSTLNQGSVS